MDVRVAPVVDGVFAFGFQLVACYVLVEDDSVTLVDAGLPRSLDAFEVALRSIGHELDHIGAIALTHHHEDHVGSAAELAEASGAAVYVHPLDAPFVKGDEPRPQLPPDAVELLAPVQHLLDDPKPVSTVRHVAEGDLAAGLRVVHTPGHTAGHVVYLHERTQALFVGDALANGGAAEGDASLMWPPFSADDEQVRASVRKLAGLRFETVCFGHGPVLVRGGRGIVRDFVGGHTR